MLAEIPISDGVELGPGMYRVDISNATAQCIRPTDPMKITEIIENARTAGIPVANMPTGEIIIGPHLGRRTRISSDGVVVTSKYGPQPRRKKTRKPMRRDLPGLPNWWDPTDQYTCFDPALLPMTWLEPTPEDRLFGMQQEPLGLGDIEWQPLSSDDDT
jgi:hypothetical protein